MTYVRNITYGKDMPVSRLTSKGQTTIPKEIRDKLDLKPGDRIFFEIESENRVVIRPFSRDIRSLAGFLHRPGMKAVSQEEMDETMRKAVADHVLGRK